MSVIRKLDVRSMRAPDRAWAADVIASSEPWLTLGRGRADALQLLKSRAKKCFLLRSGGARAGFLILDLHGPLGGYIQAIGVAPEMRGRGVGTAALCWAEARIFQKHRNVLLCVSSFNRGAARLYRRLGYKTIGRLRDYVVAGHDEILLRKTLGPLSAVEGSRPREPRPVGRRALPKSPRRPGGLLSIG
jgi:ribosomal protein S18 acetylase RimI-like enzyme